MSSTALRAAVLGAVFVATSPGIALAAPARVSDQAVVDASADGRLLLLANASVIDRVTGDVLIPPQGLQPLDLAADGPSMLARAADGTLSVISPQLGGGVTAEPMSYDDASALVPTAGFAQFGRDAQTVVFTTTEATPRILEYRRGAGPASVRATGATLTDVSSDGRVITWSRSLPSVALPAESVARTALARAVGYQVPGQTPRVVGVTRVETAIEGSCGAIDVTQPGDLQVSQTGAEGGQYLFTTITGKQRAGTPLGSRTILRLGAGSPQVLQVLSAPDLGEASISTDPRSSAAIITVAPRLAGGVTNAATLLSDDGTLTALSVPKPDGAYASFDRTVPLLRGAGFAAAVTVSTSPTPAGARPELSGTWVDDAVRSTVGPSAGAWTPLPRPADAVDGAGTAADVQLSACQPPAPVAGAPGEYAPISLATTGRSAGTVGVVLAPSGRIAARSVTATVTWYGLRVFARTATADGTITLPQLPVGLPGFKLGVRITLADGTVLTESAALRRTR